MKKDIKKELGLILETIGISMHQTYAENVSKHNHPYCEVVYIISGEISHEINGVHYNHKEGDCLIIPRGVVHSIYNPNRSVWRDISDTEKTYVGFWVKNTTGKKLTLNVNLRLWGNGAVVRGVNTLNSLEDASVIQASDTSWRYYEVELDKSKLPTLAETFPIIRLSLAVQIEGAEAGDTFYIDSFDIYHGSRA
ncbi:MAG: cupin domain-containing protein [Clostridiales bacterium]|nr:cupin domain-containing protein [Clostridiales bacterium]